MHFCSISIVFGSALFWFSIGDRPVVARPEACPVAAARTLGLLRSAALLAAASGIAWLAATIANVTGGFANLVDAGMLDVFFFETPFGPWSIARLLLLGMLAALAVAPVAPRTRITAGVVLGAALLVSQAWLGHAVEGGPGLYGSSMIASYAIHVLCAAAWTGGLPALAFALAERWRQGVGTHDMLARYSVLAIAAVALIVLSGIANTAFHVDDLARLAQTTYGAVLVTKLGLVAAMLGLAAFNRFVAMPRLRTGRDDQALGRIRTSVAVEMALAVLVFGAAAVLGLTPPPH